MLGVLDVCVLLVLWWGVEVLGWFVGWVMLSLPICCVALCCVVGCWDLVLGLCCRLRVGLYYLVLFALYIMVYVMLHVLM